jgi:Succinylglutamate desuccinylase / Aspartoacylase family
MLQLRHDLPDSFLSIEARDLHHVLSGPTLIHLPGQRRSPVFVSVLLHGNEDVGWKAIQAVLANYLRRSLPRELVLFIGNIEAAQHGLRKMPGGEDFNRVWPGTDHPQTALSQCMTQVVDYVRKVEPLVSLDLHNNTGTNPHYSCVNRLDARTLQLATLFARTIVFFKRPLGVQSAAMTEICPSLTCECGRIGDASGVNRAAGLIDACLHMLELPTHFPPSSDYHLLHTVATVKVSSDCSIAFGDPDNQADLVFSEDLDHLNFRPLPVGTIFGNCVPGSDCFLEVLDEQGNNVASTYIDLQHDTMVLRRPVVPSMLTTNIRVIRDDCLGYFMEELALCQD